jgi:scyllo-inositol 2-dehydrogenase (NADP+)
MQAIKTLVVGYGLSAKAFHLPFLRTNSAFAVAGIVQARGQAAREELPAVHHYRSLEEALAHTEAELVVVTTPNEFHAPMVRQALEAGRHVVVEKPFALEVAEAGELCQLAGERQRVLAVYHNRRWDADFLTLKKLLTEGRLGQPAHFVSRFDRFRPQIKRGWKEEPKPGTGIFYDLAPHLIDQALQLFGWPEELYAHIRMERREALTPDAFDLYLYYPELTVHLAAGSLVSASWPRFSLLGTAGSYTKWGMDPQEALLRQGVSPDRPGWGAEPAEAWGTLVRSQEGETLQESYPTMPGNYAGFYAELASAIRQGGQNPVPPEEGLLVMRILALARQSHQEGKRLLLGNM